jgi:Glycosyl transferase family 2
VFTQANQGAHAALNRGIAETVGYEFIAVLNSDDLFESRRIETCVDFLRKNPKLDVVCSRLRLIDEAGRELAAEDPKARRLERLWSVDPAQTDLPAHFGLANFIKTSSNLVGRASRFRVHPFRAYRYVHDYFFVLRCALERRLGILDEPLLRYRTHSANTIKSDPVENVARETLRMNLDLLAELAPELVGSAELRADYLRYFRSATGNHADFRAEVFLSLLAQVTVETPRAKIDEMLEAASTGRFPELLQSASREFRGRLAEAELARLQSALLASRWMLLGRIFGRVERGNANAPAASPETRVSAFKKQLNHSTWMRLGQKLRCVPQKFP